ncbi:MAG: hypothetical protein Q9160_008718 [Pyrenula sp. 1 TL-2023]
MANWSLLSPEIRVAVLEFVAQDPSSGNSNITEHPLARLATVCKEWRDFFERRNFHRLVLRQSCLTKFASVMKYRRELVRHIWLRIELRKYNCPSCKRVESRTESKWNNFTIKRAIWKLFKILGSWKLRGSFHDRGLTLELSAHSPSDSRHFFREHCFEEAGVDSDVDAERDSRCLHDPSHGWRNGQRISAPDELSLPRLFGPPILLNSRRKLKDVDVVTTLIVRRQTRRQFLSKALSPILNSLPNLRHLTYEPWRDWIGTAGDLTHVRTTLLSNYQDTLKLLSSKSLRSLTVFEDFNDTFLKSSSRVGEHDETPYPVVGAVLAKSSLCLERLSASFLADAKDFFAAYRPGWNWPNLVSLALTSLLIDQDENPAKVNMMLNTPGAVVQNMPKLQLMEIWNGGKDHACVFRYVGTRVHEPARIAWRGSWDLKLEPRVIKTWENVALMAGGQRLEVEISRIPPDAGRISSHGDAIHQLKLQQEVLHPVSLRQIRHEGKFC